MKSPEDFDSFDDYLAWLNEHRAEGKGIVFRRPSELRALGASETRRTVWGPWLAEKELALLSGKPKVGKSTLIEGITGAIVSDADAFLGWPVVTGDVVVITEENRTLALRRYASERYSLMTREDLWPLPTWADLLEAAAAHVQATGAVLVVIDTLAHWAGLRADQEKDPSTMQTVMAAQAGLLRTGAAVLDGHHQRKAGGEGGDAIRGAGSILANVDMSLEYERVGEGVRRTTGASSPRVATRPRRCWLCRGIAPPAAGPSTARPMTAPAAATRAWPAGCSMRFRSGRLASPRTTSLRRWEWIGASSTSRRRRVDSGLVDFYGEGKPGRPRHYFRPESAPSAPGPPPPGGAESPRPPYRGADYADDAAESAPGRTPGQTNGTGDPEAVERVFGEERQP